MMITSWMGRSGIETEVFFSWDTTPSSTTLSCSLFIFLLLLLYFHGCKMYSVPTSVKYLENERLSVNVRLQDLVGTRK